MRSAQGFPQVHRSPAPEEGTVSAEAQRPTRRNLHRGRRDQSPCHHASIVLGETCQSQRAIRTSPFISASCSSHSLRERSLVLALGFLWLTSLTACLRMLLLLLVCCSVRLQDASYFFIQPTARHCSLLSSHTSNIQHSLIPVPCLLSSFLSSLALSFFLTL